MKKEFDVKFLFPKVDGEPCITEEGKFSISTPYYSKLISQKISGILKKKNIVGIDACGCCGGDTIAFAQNPNIEKIYTCEPNPENFKCLEHNIKLYKLESKVSLHNIEFQKLNLQNTQADFIYFDPPWGGPEYLEKKNIRLNLGDEEIIELALKQKAKLKVLKLPKNYDKDYINEKCKNVSITDVLKKNGDVHFILVIFS